MKKIFKAVFLVWILSVTIISIAAAADSFSGTVTGDMTLNVPADFADINDALAYLSDKSIADGVLVTIQVADGLYNYDSSINVSHRDGDKIVIRGNSASPSSCKITFASGVNALSVSKGNSLGRLEGFEFVSQGSSGYHGVNVVDHSFALLNNMVINGFNGNNVVADRGSMIRSTNVIVKNGANRGFCANNGSTIYAWSTTADGNAIGYLSQKGSMIDAYSSTAKNNNTGFYAELGSFVYAVSVTTINNSTNFSPTANTVGNDNSYVKN